MKKLLKLTLTILFLSILLSSCTDKKAATTLIPEDAMMVMSYDIESLAKKANLEKLTEFSSFKSLESEIKSENRQAYNLLDDLKEDPLSAGIDLRDPIYTFMVPNGKDSFYMGISMHLWDENDFSDFVKKVFELSKMTDYKEENKNGFTHYIFENKMNISFNGDKALILFNENSYRRNNQLSALTEELTTLEYDDSIYENESFKDFIKNQGDINIFFNTDFINDIPQIKNELSTIPYRLDDNTIMAHLNFENDKIDLQMNMAYNDDIQNMYSDVLSKNDNSELLDYLPEENIGVMGASINLKSYLDYIKENFIDDNRTSRKISSLIKEMDLENIVNKVDGNFVFTLENVEEKEIELTNSWSNRSYKRNKTIPEFSFIMGISDKEYFENYITSKAGGEVEYYKGLLMLEEDHVKMYISINENSALLTTNESIALSHKVGEEIEKPLSGTNIGDAIEDYPIYATINMDTNKIPEIKKEIGSSANATLNRWNNAIKRFEYKVSEPESAQISLFMNNDDENSLFQVLQLIEQSYIELNNR